MLPLLAIHSLFRWFANTKIFKYFSLFLMVGKPILRYDITMKQIVEYLQKKNIIFKSLKEILPKELGSRKKVSLHLGVDLKG